jgi:hypothetical protein
VETVLSCSSSHLSFAAIFPACRLLKVFFLYEQRVDEDEDDSKLDDGIDDPGMVKDTCKGKDRKQFFDDIEHKAEEEQFPGQKEDLLVWKRKKLEKHE